MEKFNLDFDDDDFYLNSDARLSDKINSRFKVVGYKHDNRSGQLLECVKLKIKEVIDGKDSIRKMTIIPNYKYGEGEGMDEIPEDVKLVIRFYEAKGQSKEGNCECPTEP